MHLCVCVCVCVCVCECECVCVELGLVLSGGNETLILFYELLCMSICESILNIIPERKFQISWQPTDKSRQD